MAKTPRRNNVFHDLCSFFFLSFTFVFRRQWREIFNLLTIFLNSLWFKPLTFHVTCCNKIFRPNSRAKAKSPDSHVSKTHVNCNHLTSIFRNWFSLENKVWCKTQNKLYYNHIPSSRVGPEVWVVEIRLLFDYPLIIKY